MLQISKQHKADLLLVMSTFFWGSSYYLSDFCMSELSPMSLNAFRFVSGFLILALIFHKRMRKLNRKTLFYSLIVGFALTGTYIFYGYGITMTSLSNAGFLCALAVLFTPILNLIVYRIIPDHKFLPSMILCVTGLALLTLGDGLSLNLGDIFCLVESLCYSIDLLITEKAVKDPEVDALGFGICQLGVVGILSIVFALLFEEFTLPSSPQVFSVALFLGIFCSGITFAIQSVQQQYTSANHVGLIFTLEPVFAAIVSYVVVGERLSTRGYIGAALMLVSLVLMEVDLPISFSKKEIEFMD